MAELATLYKQYKSRKADSRSGGKRRGQAQRKALKKAMEESRS